MDTIHKLHDLLFKFALPKTSGAKNVYVPGEDLLLVRSLAPSVGEVQSGPVRGHFRQTGDRTVRSQMKFLGPGPGPPGTV